MFKRALRRALSGASRWILAEEIQGLKADARLCQGQWYHFTTQVAALSAEIRALRSTRDRLTDELRTEKNWTAYLTARRNELQGHGTPTKEEKQ